jgi:hypothetical protein
LLSGKKSVVGVKLNEEPLVTQDPGVVGASTGSGETLDSGADIETVMGAFAATAVAPSVGVTEATLSTGATGVVVVEVAGEVVVDPGTVVVEDVDPVAVRPPVAEGVEWVIARLMKAPVTPPAAKTKTIVPVIRSRERRCRTWLLATSAPSSLFEYALLPACFERARPGRKGAHQRRSLAPSGLCRFRRRPNSI